MAKNVVVCCDGTANEFTADRTNVAKLFFALVKDPACQICYYHPGIGTMAPPGVLTKTGAFLTRMAGMAWGYGLNSDIRDAYIFIANNFEEGDKLFLFGFSRGAYTARAVASLLHMYGLVGRGNEPLVPYIVRMMWAIRKLRKRRNKEASDDPRIAEYFRLADEFKATFSRVCKPHFVGVWDTVSSVGWFANPLNLPYTADNPDIDNGRHAVALDERRAFFRTNLWRPSAELAEHGPKNLKQVWFPGVHCDVGGGYPEVESGLSKIALEWMIGEASEVGLHLDPAKIETILGRHGQGFVRPDPNGCLHESLTRWWRPVEYLPKPHWSTTAKRTEWRANRSDRRHFPAHPVVHDAAWERNGYAAQLPPGAIRLSLSEYARSASPTRVGAAASPVLSRFS